MIVIHKFNSQQQIIGRSNKNSISKEKKKHKKKKKKSVIRRIGSFSISCDHVTSMNQFLLPSNTVSKTSVIHQLILILAAISSIIYTKAEPIVVQPNGAASSLQQQQQQQQRLPNEYQLSAQLGQEAHLPCLIGRQLYCGEPYFIAWYKLNVSSKLWLRIEHKLSDEADDDEQSATSSNHRRLPPRDSSSPVPVNERVHFTWTRSGGIQQSQVGNRNSWRAACDQPTTIQPNTGRNHHGNTLDLKLEANFDCAQLTIQRLELADEGQYKCEITFSESLDFDKCPATTLSQLSVIARPNEPELLINRRPPPALNEPKLTFKEGSQVKLECLSSGGRPAPRIEWLNISYSSQDQPENEKVFDLLDQQQPRQKQPPEVQLMRSHWPQKKSTFVEPIGVDGSAQQPITSSSVTISLTRYDLQSHFICLVLPQAPHLHHQQQSAASFSPNSASQGGGINHQMNIEQLIKNPTYLASLLKQNQNQKQEQQQQHNALMFKWIKFDVQVKPSSVSLIVRDLETDAPLEPIQWQHNSALGRGGSNGQQTVNGLLEHYLSPYYSLKPNRLYAIQCLVEGSRPQSQLTWFNRTLPISVETRHLFNNNNNNSTVGDFILPGADLRQAHRLTSFTQTIAHSNGTFRTSATLLITTNIWDNLEELFCRVSNEAFQFDELIQVAPIISARLYVNYAPFAWLEAEEEEGDQLIVAKEPIRRLNRDLNSRLTLRCFVAANPLTQNTILQIEWLKDGRKLTTPTGGRTTDRQQQQQQRFHIEKANHLHMPTAANQQQQQQLQPLLNNDLTSNHLLPSSSNNLGNQLVASSKLISSSSLTISPLVKADSGLYTCQYKLIPAPNGSTQTQLTPAAAAPANNQFQQIRITSGQANQTVQVNVIEAKPKAPTLKILSSKGLLVYGLRKPTAAAAAATNTDTDDGTMQSQKEIVGQQLLTLIGQPSATISLNCHLPPPPPSSVSSHQLLNREMLLSPSTRSISTNNINKQTQPNIDYPAHKIVWHLNGVQIHSSHHDTYYNFTLNSSNNHSAVAAEVMSYERIGLLSCAHHILDAGNSPDNSFHGSQIRILTSVNQFELKLKVGPKLVTKRELMPHMRSFSELELSANSASKLRLVCLAKCEPICSIDWYLNGQPLGGASSETLKSFSSAKSRLSNWSPLSIRDSPSSLSPVMQPIVLTRFVEASIEQQQQAEVVEGLSIVSRVEDLIYNGVNSNLTSSFTWFKASHLSLGRISPDNKDQVAKQVKQEALFEYMQAHDRANVYSKLELTYRQIAKLLNVASDRQIQIKCKLNSMLNGQKHGKEKGEEDTFGHLFVEPMSWFPFNNDASSTESYLNQFANEPLNLTDLSENNVEQVDGKVEVNTNYEQQHMINSKLPTDLHARKLLSLGQQQDDDDDNKRTSLDEMQITILFDKAPKSIRVSFAGIVSTDQEINGVTITHGQLLELMDPKQENPLLWCQVLDNPYPKPQLNWTFSNSNHSGLALIGDGPTLNLRLFIESFQRSLLNVDPTNAFGAEVMSNIVGNFTCTASNIHGSKSATLPIQIQGRPLCKMTLGSEYLGQDNELLANLRCLIYSAPQLLETVWFRGSLQLAVNKTLSTSLVSLVELPIVVLNKQQDFMLMDLMNQLANFKCIARNSLGYSEACELSQSDKLTLINTFKPISGLGGIKSPMLFPSSSVGATLNFLTNQTIEMNQATSPHQPMLKLEPKLMFVSSSSMPWFLITFCVVALGAWLLILLIRCLVRRCFSESSKFTIHNKHNHNTNWRFNPVGGAGSRTSGCSSNRETMGLPFQSKTVCINYYGGSNGDSEHDMMQSCSQSSHYEEYSNIGHQLQQQQPPVYFNGGHSTTLTRRTLKPSLSTSSTGESSTGSRQAQQLTRLGDKARDFIGPLQSHLQNHQLHNNNNHHHHQPKLAATMRESLIKSNGRYAPISSSTSSSNAASSTLNNNNVPLINGSHNSRINLDYQSTSQQNYRFQRDQQTFGQTRNEPIYDDVIYNQMIL